MKMNELLIIQMKEREDVTKQLKEENQMLWVLKISNIETRAKEFVRSKWIYT